MDIITYALSKKYTDDTTIGLGALKGAPCTISNISETDTEITLTLSWTGTDGTSETSVLTIPKGQDGEDGVTPFASVARNADDDGAVITITDAIGTTQVTVKDGQSGGGIQKEKLPAAAAENVGEIYQYIGATTDTLTNGFFYECVSNGDGTYSWTEKQVSQGAADYNKLDNIPLSLNDEENVVVNEKYSDFFDSLKTVEAILVEDTTTYGDDILKFPIGTYYFNNNALYKSFANHIGDYAGILTIESIDKTKDPYVDAYAYRQYKFKNYIGDIYTRALESGDIAGTLVADTDWEQVAHISDIPQEIKVLTDEEYTALIQADTIKEDVLYITINGKNMYYNKEQLNLMHISPFAYRNSVVGAMGTIGSNAIGRDSLALGNAATAAGRDAIAIGTGTETGQDVRFQVVLGSFNVVDNEGRYKFILGNGTHAGSSRRSNLHTIDTSGNAWFEGDVYVGGTSQDDATKVALETDFYVITTTEAHYEKAEAGTTGALEVVADDVTAADGQINVSNVTPVLDGEVVAAGDYVIYIAAVENKEEIYARKSNVYSKSETDTKIAEAVTGGQVDLTAYVKHEEVEVMTEEELLAKIGLSEEELEGIAQLISDAEVRIDKTYSSSKIYSELNRILEEGKTYTLEEIAKKSGASYKIATSTANMTSTEYIYLLANGDTYDMYICEEENSTPVKIGSTEIDLTGYLTTENADQTYVLKTVFEALSNNIGNVENLTTNDKTVVGAINEIDKAISEITNGTTVIPKATNADTIDGWHIYSGLTEIGLSGSVTMTDVIAAMPNKSELRFTNNTDNPNCVSDAPDKYGFLIIKKSLYVEATWIAVNRKTTVPMYFGSWHSDNGWTGWSSSETGHLSNRNYLDNSDFKINQRGLTTYSSATDAIYCMDRWLINPNMTIAYSDTGSILLTQSADQKQHFRQYLADPQRFAGKTVTLSIGTTATEGDVRLAIYDSPATMTEGTWKYADKNVFTVNIENGIRAVSIIPITLGSTIEVQWVKLEIGSAATIYSPPDYAEELLKIQTMTDDGYTKLITNDTMPIIVNSQMITNANLLDNPDFSINQRGLTEYEVASKTYTVDRWKTPNVPSLIIPGDKQITIQRHPAATSKYSGLGQVVEKLVKGVYTFSIDIVSADATIPSITMRVTNWSDIANNVSGAYYGIKSITNSTDIAGRYSLTFELPEDKENVYFYVYASNLEAEDAKFIIANAKLEAGKIATPFVAPHPAEELVKCQRYYKEINGMYSPYAVYTNSLSFSIPNAFNMVNTTPNIAFKNDNFTATGTSIRLISDGSAVEGFSGSLLIGADTNCIVVNLNKNAHGLNKDDVYLVMKNANSICLSAEL